MLYVAGVLVLSVIGIPLAIVWLCGVGQWWTRHYYDKLECDLTDRTLHFKQGILVQIEKTIPLENIQDLTFLEGPILRAFSLCMIRIETAGQGGGKGFGNEMSLIGIDGAAEFRALVLQQRQLLIDSRTQQPVQHTDINHATLLEIRDLLQTMNNELQVMNAKNALKL